MNKLQVVYCIGTHRLGSCTVFGFVSVGISGSAAKVGQLCTAEVDKGEKKRINDSFTLQIHCV